MATFDQLSAEQRAIIELVLKQNQQYEQLATMLGLPTSRVRELAREALVRLSPVSAAAVDDDWRGQLADYLLNQQTGPEATATKGHLRRSEAGRGWARSVLDSLDQFYDPASLPTIPAGEPAGASRRERKPRRDRQAKAPREPKESRPAADGGDRPSGPLSPEARDAVKRRRLAGGLGALALLLVVLFVPPLKAVSRIAGDDEKDSKPSTENAANAQPRIIGQLVLRPAGKSQAKAAGVAVIAERGAKRQLIVQAQLAPTKNRQAYEVWLYNSQKNALSMGAQVTDQRGTFQGAGNLPKDFTKYKYIDVSLEQVDQKRGHSGSSILRGRLDQLQAPQAQPQQGAPQAQPQQGAPQGTPQQGAPPQGQ
ncbi:MAG: anti-sigma factor [Thermoleophilaceae bacterium]